MQITLLSTGSPFPSTAHMRPHYTPAYDNHPLASLEEKRVYLAELYERGWDLVFGHDPFTVSAKVVKGSRGEWALEPNANGS